ncbi:MAG: hypothetical protein ACTSQG_00065 [Promethearchaeota archaeon]
MKITKKEIIRSLVYDMIDSKKWTKKEINEFWNELKDQFFAGKYKSKFRLNQIYWRYGNFLSNSFFGI